MSFLRIPGLFVVMMAVAPQTQTPALRIWKDLGLQLSFSYPAELQPRTTPSAGGSGCGKVLLAVGVGADPNQPGASDGSPASAQWASLTLSDMGPDCIPAKVLRKPKMVDQMMYGLTGGATQSLGLMPIEQPVGYLLQGRHAYVAAAQGEPISTDVVQPANGAEALAIIAVHAGNHVLIWRLASDDTNLLNRMLASLVDFGGGTPQALYPGHIGQ